jgi:cytochrome P450
MAGFKPFGVGRHQCIGMKLAWAEMRVVVARVLWQFDIKLAEERDVWDWGEQATYIFWEKRALEVLVREREEERVRRG